MLVDKYIAIKLYKECFVCCKDICKTYLYNENNEENKNDSLCGLCNSNDKQFFIPSDEFVRRINAIVEDK